MNYDIDGIYAGGAKITHRSAGSNMTHTFSASAPVERSVGYTPKDGEQPLDGAAHAMQTIDGTDYVVLNKGAIYEIELTKTTGKGKKAKTTKKTSTISAEDGSIAIAVPENVTVDSVTEHVPETQKAPKSTEDDKA